MASSHFASRNHLGYSAEILAKSQGPDGSIIATYRLTYPRFILAEVNTHKVLVKSSASSRAIPAKRLRAQVLHEPALPIYWGSNRPGMQAGAELTGWRLGAVKFLWLKARYAACGVHWLMEKLGLHKQICNRVIETWMTTTTVLTGVHWDNFFALRNHPSAQPEFRALAELMQEQDMLVPATQLKVGDWHIPFDPEDERGYSLASFVDGALSLAQRLLCSAASCARTSYSNHDGTQPTWEKNLDLATSLHEAKPPHMSPFEHQAQCMGDDTWYANFQGWAQQRYFMERNLSAS